MSAVMQKRDRGPLRLEVSRDTPHDEDFVRVDRDTFKTDLSTFLREGLDAQSICSGVLFKYLYAPVSIGGVSPDSLWQKVLGLEDQFYYVFKQDVRLIQANESFFQSLSSLKPAVIDLGCGDSRAVLNKVIPTLRWSNASSYLAIDSSALYAENAANLVAMQIPQIPAKSLVCDYMKSPDVSVDAPRLILNYGCSMGQHPIKPQRGAAEGGSLGDLLDKLGQMVDHNAILLPTIDANTDEAAVINCYSGFHVSNFVRFLFATMGAVLQSDPNPSSNYILVDGKKPNSPLPESVILEKEFTKDRLIFSFVPKHDITIVIDDVQTIIPRGHRMEGGYSNRLSMSDLKKVSKKHGWVLAKTLTSPDNPIRGPVLLGCKVSDAERRAIGSNKFASKKTGCSPQAFVAM